MAARLIFVRLPEGRLWHVEGAAAVTMCGRPLVVADLPGGRVCEQLDAHVPTGAWVCRRCRDELAEQLRAVDVALAADPRGRRTAQDRLPDATDPYAGRWEVRSWSAVAVWGTLLTETEGAPFAVDRYVDWLLREYLHPWGVRHGEYTSRLRPRALTAGVGS